MSMADNSWAKLTACKPSLSPNIQYESRCVRHEQWLIVRNVVSGEHVRLNASAAHLLSLIDGATSIESLVEQSQKHGLNADDINAILAPLCSSGMLTLGANQEEDRLLQQHHVQKRMERRSRFSNPLAIKIALHDPNRWLGALSTSVPWLFTRWFLVVLLSLIAVAITAAVVNLAVVVDTFSRVATSPPHWWLYALLYPFMKAIHELAHALVIKHWGGAVHETGITFLVLMPIPYVDASDAWMFPGKYQRMLVGAAGMLAECGLAATGLFVFLTVQPGILHEVGFAVFVMGSLSTFLFNANPLLKFDGYYILQDWLDMPNLAARSQRYCRYLSRKYLYRIASAQSPASAHGERVWLFLYGTLAGVYRCIITVVIALFLASQFLIVGVALALFALFQLLVKPLLTLTQYLRNAPELNGIRYRSIATTMALAGAAALIVVFLPMPSSTRTEGVVWVPNQAQVFAAESGVVQEMLALPGSPVEAGQVLIRLSARELLTRKRVVQAELETVRISHRAALSHNTAKAQSLAADIATLESELTNLTQRTNQLDISAKSDGLFVVDEQMVIPGKSVKQGDLLAYVVNKEDLVVKAVLTQQRIERLQAGVTQAHVRLADDFSEALEATLTRQTPAAKNTLPSPALAYDGQGGIAVASQQDEQLKTLERVFHIELALPAEAVIAGIGGRAYVTLHHQPESLGTRWWRSTRQLLLKQLTV